MDIYMTKADGPYTLRSLWVTNVENPTKSDFAERELAYAEPGYQSSSYRYADFGVAGATLTGAYSHSAIDTDGDGQADALAVETGLDVGVAGAYAVYGTLFGGQGDMVSQASWTGSGSPVSLVFEGLRDTVGPYTLRYLHVRDAAGQVTDGITEPHVLGDVPELSARPVSLGIDASVPVVPGEIGATFVITGGYSDIGVDTDGDGQFDQLVIETTVEVEPDEGGQAYRLEGWLVDENDSLISWAVGDPQVLAEGLQTLSLAFDGRIIHEHGVDGPYTLMALKVLPGDRYEVLNMVDIAYTTSGYDHDQFEAPMLAPAAGVFEDDMEDGTDQWTAESPWVLDGDEWHSYSHAWQAEATGAVNGPLTTISLDLSNNAYPTLRFKTCYEMGSAGDMGRLEASTNGTEWTEVASYPDSTPHWSTQVLDLSSFADEPALLLRFNAISEDNLLWYVDDVYLTGWPDDDGDGISNADEDLDGDGNPADDDSDGDGTPNYLDSDDDGDGVLTADEDFDGDGNPANDNTDGDGLPNYLDPDDDDDGVLTADEDFDGDGNPANDNTDGDGLPNYLDPDDDDDGVLTEDEDFDGDGNPADDDSDRDGLPNYLDPDDDGDGIPTPDEILTGDQDGDHVPDYLEPNNVDTDADGTYNHLDDDDDGDGVPTAEEDWNQDGNPTNDDANGNSIPDYLDADVTGPSNRTFLPLVIK
jgi:hypothetical protein